MRDANLDKIQCEYNLVDAEGNQWNIQVKEDLARKFRIYTKCNEHLIGRPLYFNGRDKCFEYLNTLFKNKKLKEI